METTTITEENKAGYNTEGEMPNYPLKCLTATSVIGDKVENKQGENLGTIKDVMLNIAKGAIEYYVVEFSAGFWETDKYFAFTPDQLVVNPDKRVFVLDKTKDALKNEPGFDIAHWPETNLHYSEISDEEQDELFRFV